MLMAQLHGKISSDHWLTSEDLLTSAVFGTVKNLPDSVARELFSQVLPIDGSYRPSLEPPLSWSFWPQWDTCEPDVVVEDGANLCVIEAKLYSDFGDDVGRGSQLAREWRDAKERADALGKQCWLIAITNHASLPKEALIHQLAGADYPRARISWLGWSTLARFIWSLEAPDAIGWCSDLYEVMSRMGLAPFDGFGVTIQLSRKLPDVWRLSQSIWQEGHTSPSFAKTIELAATLGQTIQWGPNLTVQASVGFQAVIDQAKKVQSRRSPWIPRLK